MKGHWQSNEYVRPRPRSLTSWSTGGCTTLEASLDPVGVETVTVEPTVTFACTHSDGVTRNGAGSLAVSVASTVPTKTCVWWGARVARLPVPTTSNARTGRTDAANREFTSLCDHDADRTAKMAGIDEHAETRFAS